MEPRIMVFGFPKVVKRTSGICHLFENYLVSGISKKKYSIALSITEAEYVGAGNLCAQVLWLNIKKSDTVSFGIMLKKVMLVLNTWI